MKKFTITVFAIVLSFPLHSANIDTCKKVAETTNKSLPYKKDRITVVRETGCVIGKPKNKFVYVLDIDVNAEDIRGINIGKDLKPDNLNIFCSDPNLRVVLKAFDIDHRYYARRGIFAGSFLMQDSECK